MFFIDRDIFLPSLPKSTTLTIAIKLLSTCFLLNNQHINIITHKYISAYD